MSVSTVCTYKQYECCGKTNCPLFERCSVLPITTRTGIKYFGVKTLFSNPFNSTEKEKKRHKHLYAYYNRLFGDLRKKNIERNRRYYKEHKEEWKRDREYKKEHDTRLLCVQKGFCNEDCEHCIYDDCIVPEIISKSHYHKLYRAQNREHLLKQESQYREHHRQELREKAKQYYAENQEKCKARMAAYRQAHKEERREYDKKRRQNPAYKEKQRQRAAKYREEHREEIRARNREYMRNKRAAEKLGLTYQEYMESST